MTNQWCDRCGIIHGPELTPRLLEALETYAHSATAKEAAERMGIKPVTIRHHLNTAYCRLGVNSAGEAFRKLNWLRPRPARRASQMEASGT